MHHFHSEIYPEENTQFIERKSGTFRRLIVDLLETVVLSLILFLGINTISARIRIESISMQPTLHAGDYVIVNKLAYKLDAPDRGDVIIFHYPPDPKREPYIKRIIGLPGDTVTVANGQVLINGTPIYEPYISSPPAYQGKWLIPEGALFVLGDNRNSSSDSHSWGMVPISFVIGKAEVVYWPPSEWKMLGESTAVAAEP